MTNATATITESPGSLRSASPGSVGTVTSTALLRGLGRASNEDTWRDYVERYRPLIVQYARRVGLPAEEAEDLAQAALFDFATDYRAGKYDRERGRLRSWLFGIVSNQVRAWRRARAARRELLANDTPRGDDMFGRLEAPEELERAWEDECQQAVLQRALIQVRGEVDERTAQAFELFALHGIAAQRVAGQLGMTQNAVFGAKRRILRRLRELTPFIEETW